MKKVFLVLIIFVFLVGCENKEEKEKNYYLSLKSKLLETKKYTSSDDIPCDITVKVNRLDKEQVLYKIVLFNPKENMNNVEVIVVHNYYTEDLFPSVGLFNQREYLKVGEKKKISLSGRIETIDDIDKLNLEFKVLIKYKTDDNKNKDIYYKTT